MTRKLLPYEHDLVKALGVSEEEFLDFLAAQHDFTRSAEEQMKELRADALTAGIALAVIGILFQVGSALLMPKPPGQKNQQRSRDQRFAPRFGFNSTQELAVYGDTVNLIYCNTRQNPKGGVRASTSLAWSSVESYGSSQFMQLLLVLGAARVKRIDFNRVAFGQLPISEFNDAKTWLYYQQDGRVTFANKVIGDNQDPTRFGAPNSDDVCKIIDGGRRLEGYSQAFSPSSLTSLGVYSPIPINVDVMERDIRGTIQWAEIGITISGNSWQTGSDNVWSVGNEITVVFRKAFERQDKVEQEAAKELRYQSVASLDLASVYMLGTAKFKLVSISDNTDLDDNEIRAKFSCIESGRRPFTEYNAEKAKIYNDDDRQKLEIAENILKSPYEETALTGPFSAGLALANKIKGLAPSLVSTLTRTTDYAFDTLLTNGFSIKFGSVSYDFTGAKTFQWRNELDEKQSYVLVRGGSIAYTKKILEQFLSDKPKISTAKLRDELDDDLEKIRALRDKVMSGDYDKALRKEARNNSAVKAINKDIERLKEELDSRIKEGKSITEIEKEIERRREDKQDIVSDIVSSKRSGYVRFVRETDNPFTGLDGNRYPGGIGYIKRRLNKIKGEFTTDQIGVERIRTYFRELIAEKEEALKFVEYVTENWETIIAAADDHFYTKCLVKIDSAAYQSVTACNFVKFSIRCKLFRRVSGRQEKYGEKKAPDGFKLSDNGIKGRMAFFKMFYRSQTSNNFTVVPIIFAVRRSADLDNFIALNFESKISAKWEFRFEPIGDIGAEIRGSGQKQFAFIENSGKRSSYLQSGNEFSWVGRLTSANNFLKPALEERGPLYTNEWDLFSIRSDTQIQFSFEGGPELAITAVTEQQLGSLANKFDDMSAMAFGVFAGRGVQDLRSITAYVLEGKSSYVVNENTGAYGLSANSTSYAPDIFADSILDKNDGIGKFAKPEGVDWQGLALAKRFCKNNGLGCQLFMDGVIAEPQSWRQFWAEVAPYSLLEFARVGGRETLIPAIPVSKSGRANREVQVSALFTQGNIIEGSYKEEFLDYGTSVQDLIATVIYRETEREDVFPRNASVDVMLRGVNEGAAIRQTFDISQFVSQREQAILFGKLLCNQRRWIRRGIEFQTFPTDSPISPGAYIYVDIGLNSWDRITSGVVMPGGVLNAPLTDGIPNGSYSVLVYQSGGDIRSLEGVAVSGGVASSLASFAGHLFVLGAKADRKRVFRVTEVQMDEDGQVSVKAMEHPCQTVDGKLLSQIANFTDGLFSVR